jgi:hypothetical protein
MKPNLTIACIALATLVACAPIEALPLPSSLPPTVSATSTEPAGEKGPAFISFSELLLLRNSSTPVGLHIKGDLPTPCNRFWAEVAEPDAQKNIQVTVYSIVTTQAMCARVLQPFDETVPIDMRNRFDGTYSVYLNGEAVGQIIVEGGQVSAISL